MKKSNIVLLTAFILLLVGVSAMAVYFRSIVGEGVIEGDRNIQKEVRESEPFSRVKAAGNMKIYYTQDTVNELVVEADSNLLKYIVTEIWDDELKISFDRIMRARNVKIYISNSKELQGINLTAGSHLVTQKPVDFDDMRIIGNGGARLNMEGNFNNIFLEINAGSNFELSGICNDLRIVANAGSNLKAKNLTASSADVSATSGSNLDIYVVNSLSVNASSGSNINYYGDPELKDIQTGSGANLRRK